MIPPVTLIGCLHFVEVKGALIIPSIGPSFPVTHSRVGNVRQWICRRVEDMPYTWRRVEDRQFVSSGLRFSAAVLIFFFTYIRIPSYKTGATTHKAMRLKWVRLPIWPAFCLCLRLLAVVLAMMSASSQSPLNSRSSWCRVHWTGWVSQSDGSHLRVR